MGGWRLEVARMALYMSFPVALFHFFNQPEYFEEWVTATKRELYPPENKLQREELQRAIRKIEEKHNQQMLEEFERLKK